MQRIGYACVRIAEEDVQAQVRALEAANCVSIYVDRDTSTLNGLKELPRVVEDISRGDRLVVTTFDRLGVRARDCYPVVLALFCGGVSLEVLEPELLFKPTQLYMLLEVLCLVDEMDRVRHRERQLAGIGKAKAAGRYRGGERYVDYQEVKRLRALGHSVAEIAEQLHVSRQTIYKALQSAD